MNQFTKSLPSFIFWSRWLQAPLYFGLILVLGGYVYEFGVGLITLYEHLSNNAEMQTMMQALDLIDMVMIANLLIMVIVGGYETFVSRLNIYDHPDSPEWLGEVKAGTMKVKLGVALVTISSIHLLRTFMDPAQVPNNIVMWQVVIHLTLVVSTLALAFSNTLTGPEKNSAISHKNGTVVS
jgi:uncharacterized protein (TIGR00645 family)